MRAKRPLGTVNPVFDMVLVYAYHTSQTREATSPNCCRDQRSGNLESDVACPNQMSVAAARIRRPSKLFLKFIKLFYFSLCQTSVPYRDVIY